MWSILVLTFYLALYHKYLDRHFKHGYKMKDASSVLSIMLTSVGKQISNLSSNPKEAVYDWLLGKVWIPLFYFQQCVISWASWVL